MAGKIAVWESQEWMSRKLELDLGVPLVHHRWRRCRRNFVDELRTEQRYAVYVGAVNFDRLANEVSVRWLADQCPGAQLKANKQICACA
jgi:hypothetical protein